MLLIVLILYYLSHTCLFQLPPNKSLDQHRSDYIIHAVMVYSNAYMILTCPGWWSQLDLYLHGKQICLKVLPLLPKSCQSVNCYNLFIYLKQKRPKRDITVNEIRRCYYCWIIVRLQNYNCFIPLYNLWNLKSQVHYFSHMATSNVAITTYRLPSTFQLRDKEPTLVVGCHKWSTLKWIPETMIPKQILLWQPAGSKRQQRCRKSSQSGDNEEIRERGWRMACGMSEASGN